MFSEKKILKSLFLLIVIFFLFFNQNSASAKDYTVRIGIVPSAKEVIISSSVATPIILKKSGGYSETITTIQPLVPFYFTGDRNGISLYENENFIGKYNGIISIKPQISSDVIPLVYASGHWYRGGLEIFSSSNKNITVVNSLPIEEYHLNQLL